MKTVSNKQIEFLDLIDKMIEYLRGAKKEVSVIHITKAQKEIYAGICTKKKEFSRENTDVAVDIDTLKYRGISLIPPGGKL